MSVSTFFEGLNWPAFLLAMVVVELTPGPNMGWLAAHAAQAGRRAGFIAVAGVTLGLAVHLLAAISGLSALIGANPLVFQALRWAGILFMVYLAVEAFREDGRGVYDVSSASKGFWRGFLANVLNPKALIFYVAVVGQFAVTGAGPLWAQILILGALHLVVSMLVHSAIVLAGDRLGAALQRWQGSLALRAGFAMLLLGIAVWLAFATA
jgi:threonine/homoserine/homoserine lactone efflux protein